MKISVIGIILLCLIGFISCKGSDSSSGDSASSSSTDKIILFEDLSNEFKNLVMKKSWEVELINSESTKSIYKKDWRSYYCRESLKIVSKIYKKDLEIFGYNIEDTFRNIKIKNSR